MTRLEEVRKLRGRGKRKKSFADIARKLGISRQRVHALATGYEKRYRHTSTYRMYRRHSLRHFMGAKARKPCDYCAEEKANMSIGFTRQAV